MSILNRLRGLLGRRQAPEVAEADDLTADWLTDSLEEELESILGEIEALGLVAIRPARRRKALELGRSLSGQSRRRLFGTLLAQLGFGAEGMDFDPPDFEEAVRWALPVAVKVIRRAARAVVALEPAVLHVDVGAGKIETQWVLDGARSQRRVRGIRDYRSFSELLSHLLNELSELLAEAGHPACFVAFSTRHNDRWACVALVPHRLFAGLADKVAMLGAFRCGGLRADEGEPETAYVPSLEELTDGLLVEWFEGDHKLLFSSSETRDLERDFGHLLALESRGILKGVTVVEGSFREESTIDSRYVPESIEITVLGRRAVTERVDVYGLATLARILNEALRPDEGDARFHIIQTDDDLGFVVARDEQVRRLAEYGYLPEPG